MEEELQLPTTTSFPTSDKARNATEGLRGRGRVLPTTNLINMIKSEHLTE